MSEFKKNICRVVGHDWGGPEEIEEKVKSPPGVATRITIDTWASYEECRRCGEQRPIQPKVKYSDLMVRRYSILDRAKKRGTDTESKET